MQKQRKTSGVGGRLGEVITTSERSTCQSVTFPSYVLSARNPPGAVTYTGVILQSNSSSLEMVRARVKCVHDFPRVISMV